MNDQLKLWMQKATSAEWAELAQAVGTSPNTLDGYACGHRSPSAERAIEIEKAAAPITKRSKGRLPRVLRTDLSRACAGCDFAKRCLGAAAAGSDFDVVED